MFNLDVRTRTKLSWLGMMILPVLGVQAARFIFASTAGPASAGAAIVAPNAMLTAPMPVLATPARELNAQQKAAIAWLQNRSLPDALRSPFDRPDPTPVQVDQPPVAQTTIAAEPQIEAAPRLTISGIIADAASGIVSINHKLYRVGDEIAKGWTLVEIDSKQRVVRIRHADGRTIELSPPTPGLKESSEP